MSPRELRLPGRHTLKIGNALLGGLLVWVMLGSSPTTAAYLSVALADASNVVATAKQFIISDVAAVAKPAGSILVSWSAASWAAGGYSVRRSTSASGPFAEIVVVGAGTSSYSDTSGVDGVAYSYKVFGLSGAGGMGTGSIVASATADATSPTVASTLPSAGATNTVLNTSATITFSEAMNAAPTGARMALVDCGASAACASGATSVSGAASWPTSSSLVFMPTAPLTASHWYGLELTTAATDLSGNALSCAGASAQTGSTCFWTFETGSSAGAPGLAASAPRAGATGVPTNTTVSFVWTAALSGAGQSDASAGFSLQQVSGVGSPCYVYSGSGQVPLCAQHGGAWTNPFADGSLLTPTNPLLANTTYTAAESANDTSNLVVSSSATWTTAAGADSTPPTVTRVVPDDAASGINAPTTVSVTFSEAMDVAATAHAFSLKPWSGPGSCVGALGTATTGSLTWNGSAELVFHPAADLTAGTCYHVAIAGSSADVSGNSLGNGYGGSNFTVFGGAAPSVTLGGGAYYYPGATISASGSGWSTGSGNVNPKWDDGTTLDAVGAPVDGAGSFSEYAFSLPSNASSGSHTISFVRSGGATIGVTVTVQSPSSISLSASSTDISAGGSATITATVYDQGQPAANALVGFVITTDVGSRGSFVHPGSSVSSTGLTNGLGQPPAVTLYVSSGGGFTPITVTVTSGSVSKTITIIDPAPLPPQTVRLTASDRLEIAWEASPSASVTQYQLSLGSASGRYDHVISVGHGLGYTEMDVLPGSTYYVVVRAADGHGALSDASPEVHITVPLPATPTATSSPTATASATATATASSTSTPTIVAPSATATATVTPMATRTPTATATPMATPTRESTATVAVPSGTPTPAATPSAIAAALVSTATAVLPTSTATAGVTPDGTPGATPDGTPGATLTATPVPTTTASVAPTATSTATSTAVIATATATATATPGLTSTPVLATPTATATATSGLTSTPVPATPTATATTAPATSTATVAPTSTPVSTSTPMPTATRTPVPTSSPTPTH